MCYLSRLYRRICRICRKGAEGAKTLSLTRRTSLVLYRRVMCYNGISPRHTRAGCILLANLSRELYIYRCRGAYIMRKLCVANMVRVMCKPRPINISNSCVVSVAAFVRMGAHAIWMRNEGATLYEIGIGDSSAYRRRR